MDILDKHFIGFSAKRKSFLIVVSLLFFLISLASYFSNLLSAISASFLFLIGILFVEMLKLEYRIEDLEKKNKK